MTFPLEQANFEVQKFGRHFQQTCRLEEAQPHLKGVKYIVIIQHNLSSKDVRLVLQPVTLIQNRQLMESAKRGSYMKDTVAEFMGKNNSLDMRRQVVVDYGNLTAGVCHVKALAGPFACSHRGVLDTDIHCVAHLFGVVRPIFHFQAIACSLNQFNQQNSHLIPE